MGSGLSMGEYIKETSYTNLTDNNIKNILHERIIAVEPVNIKVGVYDYFGYYKQYIRLNNNMKLHNLIECNMKDNTLFFTFEDKITESDDFPNIFGAKHQNIILSFKKYDNINTIIYTLQTNKYNIEEKMSTILKKYLFEINCGSQEIDNIVTFCKNK